MIRSTQKKFLERMQAIADTHDGLQLIVDFDYANTGTISFQQPQSFKAVLSFPFSFQHSSANLASLKYDAEKDPLGVNSRGGRWTVVKGEELDALIVRIEEVLDSQLAHLV